MVVLLHGNFQWQKFMNDLDRGFQPYNTIMGGTMSKLLIYCVTFTGHVRCLNCFCVHNVL